jgi:hypothetical protein
VKSKAIAISAFLLVLLAACQSASRKSLRSETFQASTNDLNAAGASQPEKRNQGKLIHVLVALCDNQYQGIVPVPARIGNGDDPPNNLYWGARFGVKTFFKRAGDWRLITEARNPREEVLERLVFKHQNVDDRIDGP